MKFIDCGDFIASLCSVTGFHPIFVDIAVRFDRFDNEWSVPARGPQSTSRSGRRHAQVLRSRTYYLPVRGGSARGTRADEQERRQP